MLRRRAGFRGPGRPFPPACRCCASTMYSSAARSASCGSKRCGRLSPVSRRITCHYSSSSRSPMARGISPALPMHRNKGRARQVVRITGLSTALAPWSGAVRPGRAQWDRGERMRNWKYVIAAAAIGLAAFLLYRTLSRYSLDQLIAAVTAVPVPRLLGAAGFAAASYLSLTFLDYLALYYVKRPLPYRKAALASFTALSLGHNIGLAALSSGAVRYRFYNRWGLKTGEVAKVIVFCGITVGLGLLALGGAALLLRS